MGSSKDEAVRSAASAGDSFLKAAPIWNSFAMMCATYTLYQAPFWVSKAHIVYYDCMVAPHITKRVTSLNSTVAAFILP